MTLNRTSQPPPHYDVGKARSRGQADGIVAELRARGCHAYRHGRSVSVDAARAEDAAKALRSGGIELDWAPAPVFQERHVEWQIVVLTGLATVLAGVGALLVLHDNYWGAVCMVVAPPLYMFIFWAIHP